MSDNLQNVPPMPNVEPVQQTPPVPNVEPVQQTPPLPNVEPVQQVPPTPNGTVNPTQPQKKTDLPLIALICGISSIVLALISCFCCIGYLCIPASIAAIVIAMKVKKENNNVWDSQAKIGFICGIVGLVLFVLVFLIALIAGIGIGLYAADAYSYSSYY